VYGDLVDEGANAGLRERKKAAVRQLIVQVSHRLFAEHGFDAVTLEQIADGCVMSVRTILRYFATKEALALAPEHDALERFRASIAARDTDAVTCWRAFVGDLVADMVRSGPDGRRRLAVIAAHPALHAEFLRIGHAYEDILAGAIDEENGGKNPLGSRLFATVLVAGTSATFREWIDDPTFDVRVLADVVDYAAEAFRPDLATRTATRTDGRRRKRMR
jgi:AcrR family transcriptional regulator